MKKYFYLVLILIFFITLAIIGFFYFQKQSIQHPIIEPVKKDNNPHNLIPEKSTSTAETKTIAVKKKKRKSLVGFTYKPINEESCDKKQDNKEREKCLDLLKSDKALFSDDYKICSEIKDGEIQYYCFMKFVRKNLDMNLCKMIKDQHFQEVCAHYVAFRKGDEDLCKKITDGKFEEEECLGPILAYKYGSEGNVEACKNITILEYPNLCFNLAVDYFDRDCSKFKKEEDRIRCNDIVSYDLALNAKDIKICESISDNTRRQVCQNSINLGIETDTDGDGLYDDQELFFNTNPFVFDTDGDNLSDGEEMLKYHTNPSDVDTDNDGYNDGDEIKNGYNPKGEGKLRL